MSILVVDVGSSSVRAAMVRPDGTVTGSRRTATPPTVGPGSVDVDADAIAAAALGLAAEVIAAEGAPEAVGITAQRASAVAWDEATGRMVAPAIGWQDLRTVFTCLELQGEGIRLSPAQSATKFAWLAETDAGKNATRLRLSTFDAWIAWKLSGGGPVITDLGNAAVTGLLDPADPEAGWQGALLERLGIPPEALPEIVDTSGHLGVAGALRGSPPICALAGDQQASLMGQGCVRPGQAKITFGTGAMLDLFTGDSRPDFSVRGEAGCFPVIPWRRNGRLSWGVEAMMLTAGSAVDWLVEDLGLLPSAADSEAVASECPDTGDVVVVPAFMGLAAPAWDFGARATVLGISRGAGKGALVRAVLEGVAQRGADLVASAEEDGGMPIEAVRVDGGMTANGVFVQALADACARPVEVSAEREATALGVGFLAGLAIGTWKDEDDVAAAWSPARVVEPVGPPRRERWAEAIGRAEKWLPDLSAVQF